MNLHITGKNVDITNGLQEYAVQKIKKVLDNFLMVTSAQIQLNVERQDHTAEITVHIPGKDIHCSATESSLHAAIDVLSDKLDRAIVKYKTKKISARYDDPVKEFSV